ncbi:pimeloyl-ACP methyl esterase BioG family protein [Candidatus Cetobacterium colombiensis]|uniref:DUF452 family protein n=1 Tax=Candidatus Cetobacterium colombiensis TaxID=3073100 RepID=A0ABU4WA44_9FUSO|nr:pimeloyl-ACP methyl esterase BioG family protein [Candidatus Cetobacterium colombiensis]MDX8336391.1 DUF452 family protein [Candidatus Cetobacterium colombiensis]
MHLILFFNGWGMNEDIIKNIIPKDNMTVKCINYPYIVKDIEFFKYKHIFVVGWSFGVYYASKFLLENKYLNCTSIAINGVPCLIGEYGISLKMFKLTLNTLSNDNLKKFYLNMGLSLKFFPKKPNLEILKKELSDILNSSFENHCKFDRVFLGKYDRIIPYSKQLKFYTKESSFITTLDCGHYPFETLKNWRDITCEKNEF